MKNRKIIIWIIILALITVTLCAIILPFLLGSKENFKEDGNIEIWTTSSQKDQFYNSFEENFVDEFNKTSEMKVELVTVTPQISISSDIALKMEAKGEVPNLFIGKGQDSIYLSEFENDFVSLMDMSEYTESNVLDYQSEFHDDFLNKNIKPYASLMINGESLYINKLQMNSFIKFIDENVTEIFITESFKSLFDYNEYVETKKYFSIENLIDNELLNGFISKYPILDVDIFETYEGIVELSRLINSLMVDEKINTLGFDNDVSTSMYTTFNFVENNIDDWMFNSKNELNFVDSKIAQEAYSDFVNVYSQLINEGVMWVRENDNTNPTAPFVNDELTMFIGANFNSKYINSDVGSDLQYEEAAIIKAPTKVLESSLQEFVFIKPKTINGLSFGTEEDKVAGDFVNFVLENLNSDFDFFINEGYLPPITTEDDFESFYKYINNEINFIGNSDKENSLLMSLRATTESIYDSLYNDNFDIFDVPQLHTTSLFESILFESNRISNGDDAVEYLISQLKTNA